MNTRRLQIYVDDHLALLVAELELAARCSRSNRGTPLGDSLATLQEHVTIQKDILEDVKHRLGGRTTIESQLKQGGGWLAEKLGRLKLNDSFVRYSPLSRLVELETLAAAAQARVSLWENPESACGRDSRFDGISWAYFREQSTGHLEDLNCRRRFAAAEAFSG